MLIPVPAEPYGPGGVLVVSEGSIAYKKIDHDDRECVIPVRNEQLESRGVFMISHSTFTMKTQDQVILFFLIQSEYGDLYKVSMDFTGASVHNLSVQYFDTIAPCTQFNILRPGYLFTAGEFNNHVTYSFLGNSTMKKDISSTISTLVTFNPRGDPLNLAPTDEFQNLASINDMKIEDLLGEG
jgi:splicing factor 3B subunit 3